MRGIVDEYPLRRVRKCSEACPDRVRSLRSAHNDEVCAATQALCCLRDHHDHMCAAQPNQIDRVFQECHTAEEFELFVPAKPSALATSEHDAPDFHSNLQQSVRCQ
jgi:hypothetical protein